MIKDNQCVAFIVPTKDRPEDLLRMLASLSGQARRPDQVIVVDASSEPVERIVRSVDGLAVDYVRWASRPSAAAQRNGGLTKVREDIDLVCFFDDDQILHPDALEKMLAFWQTVSADLGGASFNMANYEDSRSGRLKKSRFSDVLGLYCCEPGRVAPSGWQSLYGKVERNIEVDWMGSGASVWRKSILDKYQFDPFFDGYSYLEDLDFSYSVSRRYKLVVVADAMFEHYPRYAERSGSYHFGVVESRNRLYFVRKHGLSIWRCCLGLLIRWLMTLKTALLSWDRSSFQRALGNLAGVVAPGHP